MVRNPAWERPACRRGTGGSGGLLGDPGSGDRGGGDTADCRLARSLVRERDAALPDRLRGDKQEPQLDKR
jgi:hypothetical protein